MQDVWGTIQIWKHGLKLKKKSSLWFILIDVQSYSFRLSITIRKSLKKLLEFLLYNTWLTKIFFSILKLRVLCTLTMFTPLHSLHPYFLSHFIPFLSFKIVPLLSFCYFNISESTRRKLNMSYLSFWL